MARESVAFDPAVLAALSDGDRRSERRAMTPTQRKRAASDDARVKDTYDLPKWLKDAIADLAAEEHCSKSSVAAFLLARGLEAYRRGDWDFEGYYEHSRSPRCQYVLKTPDVEELLDT